MEDSICLDSDILVEILRNNRTVIDWIGGMEEKYLLATTIINIFELYYGAYKSNLLQKDVTAIKDIINWLEILDLSIESVEEAGKQKARLEKEGKTIEFRDILIGTIALTEGYSLKTGNKKHFERIEGLKLI